MVRMVQHVDPGCTYTTLALLSQTCSKPHVDRFNLPTSNLVLPLQVPCNGGGIWIEHPEGSDTRWVTPKRQVPGHVVRLEPLVPLYLDPHKYHATETWTTGLRTVVVAFALKGIQRASKHSCDQLLTLGFPLPNLPNSPTCTSTLKHQPCSEGQNQLQDTSGVHADGRDGGRGLSVVDSPPTFQALPDASKVTVDGQDGGRVHSLVNAHGALLEPNQANHVQAVYVHVHAHLKVLDPILWSTLHFSTPPRPNHRRHTFTTAATVCLGCGLSLNITCETYNIHWALRVTCTIEMFVTPSSTHVVLFIH